MGRQAPDLSREDGDDGGGFLAHSEHAQGRGRLGRQGSQGGTHRLGQDDGGSGFNRRALGDQILAESHRALAVAQLDQG